MPFDRGRGLTELWVAAGWPAHRRLHPESIPNELQTVASKSRRTSWPRDQPRGQEQDSCGIDAPPAQRIERKRKALEQGMDEFSSFRAFDYAGSPNGATNWRTTTARRRGRLAAGVADWPIERSLLPIFPRWHNLFLRPDQDGGAQRASPRSPYVGTRSIADTRQSVGTAAPDYLWGWLVHPCGESRDASGRINRIGPRPAQPPAT